jgi:hypothetical protein
MDPDNTSAECVDFLINKLYHRAAMKKALITLFLLMMGTAIFAQSEDDFEIVQKSGGITVIGYAGTQTEVVIPAHISGIAVYSVGKSAFAGRGLVKIILPVGLKTIEDSAFSNNRLTSVVIPDTVTGIADDAFSGNRIKELALSNRLVFLGGGAFAENRLETLVIPASLDHIPGGAFRGNLIKTLDLGGAKMVIARAFDGAGIETVKVSSGANINSMCGLDASFINFYNSNGKRAGTYVKNGKIWTIR